MKKPTLIIVLVATIVLFGCLFLPIWKIQLEAPQYPEGLEMKIWLNKFSGDVHTINGLNHYIGMMKITEDKFPDFLYMRNITIFLIITGFLVAILRKKHIFNAWFVIFFTIACIGVYRFWRWEYEYGHNLDPSAAIKIPGMSYQPPMLGCKQLLNFNACSFPDFGGLIVIAVGTLSFIGVLYENNILFVRRQKKNLESSS